MGDLDKPTLFGRPTPRARLVASLIFGLNTAHRKGNRFAIRAFRGAMAVVTVVPKLAGVTMLLLQRQLTAAGIRQAEDPVRVQDLTGYHGMI